MFRKLILALLLVTISAELVMEISFDLALKEQTETGFKPTDALNLYLQSKSMKWLRSFHMIVSGQIAKPQRVAFLAFKDAANWAEFEEEHLVKTHALFDHFWLNSKRVLWSEVAQEGYPSRTRSMEKPGGFMWQFKWTVIPGKEQAFNSFWAEHEKKVLAELEKNQGFVESKRYDSMNMQRTFGGQMIWEFLGMPSLTESVIDGAAMKEVYAALPKYCSDWNTAILAPPTDENGKTIGFFYPAAGADPGEETAEKEKEDL
eukprot:NODE_4829_length_1012_cov_254.325084_g4623_i0.p1 GENE.NODE_4829_length_1012_cov_254.325084_g4623_i0~~NODE_4829_length_1012_cov_254.325084_g4623_i0.p1  ORF type:complete len:277 (-),score=115.21 NODE_4829_length_1012_cov_254.325084_g4623_i0:182-961(-)